MLWPIGASLITDGMAPFTSQLLWVVASFLSGSLPFSLWIGHLILGKNIREYGDGNPGASNVARAGGLASGGLAVLLDFLKGALPVGAARFGAGVDGLAVVLVALAPVFGHAFSPILSGKGGKALATTVGIWSGLTIVEAPLILGLFFTLWELLLDVDGWAVMMGMAGLLAHLLLNHGDPLLLAVWVGNTALLAWTHRHDLSRLPGLRGWWR